VRFQQRKEGKAIWHTERKQALTFRSDSAVFPSFRCGAQSFPELTKLNPEASKTHRQEERKLKNALRLQEEVRYLRTNQASETTHSWGESSDDDLDPDEPRVKGNVGLKEQFNAEQLLKIVSCLLHIFTDASVKNITDSANPRSSGIPASAGAAIFYKSGVQVRDLKATGGQLACSYSAERGTILLALETLLDNLDTLFPEGGTHNVAIVTDSLSTLLALQRGPFAQTCGENVALWEAIIRLRDKGISLHFTFVYSHLGVAGNEAADTLAGANVSHPIAGLQWVDDVVRREVTKITSREDAPEACPYLRAQGGVVGLSDPKSLLRLRLPSKSVRLLLQLRTGACSTLGGHLAEAPDKCKICGADGVLARGGKAVHHLFTCPGALDVRKSMPWYQDSLLCLQNLAEGNKPQTAREWRVVKESVFGVPLLWAHPKRAVRYLLAFLELASTVAAAPQIP